MDYHLTESQASSVSACLSLSSSGATEFLQRLAQDELSSFKESLLADECYESLLQIQELEAEHAVALEFRDEFVLL